MDAIRQTYVIAASPEEVWQALTDPVLIRQWSGAAAEFPDAAGAAYALWDGTITGTVMEMVPPERLVQTWKPADWQRDDSVVRFTLVPEDGTTVVDLVHENVEEFDYDGTNEGWDIYYLGAIKRMLETRAASKTKTTRRRTAKQAAGGRKTAASKKSAARKKAGADKKAATTKRATPQKKTAPRRASAAVRSRKTARSRTTTTTTRKRTR